MLKESTRGVLYRKYRPQFFDEVIGQEHIVKVLKGSIELNNISHAYLFSGTRGTGKTSLARIFARAIGTSSNDLFEMDSASNRGIDDIREIRESVNTLPFNSKYKVYIIDEAHMLTRDAWNAFLKTLEEPPAHVIFILATTEFEKVPETVISRCQCFSFKSPNLSLLKEFALSIAKKEGFSLDPDAGELIALFGDGSFRDAHGILEKVLSSTRDKKVTREDVENVTGAPKALLIREVLEAVVEKNLEKGLKAVSGASGANVDMKFFAKILLERMRFLFLLRLRANMEEYISKQISEDDFLFLEALAKKAGGDLNSDKLFYFIEAYENTGRTQIPELALEIALSRSIT